VAADDAPSYARKLGIQRGQVVQEWGWDEDTDDDVRADVEDACGGELLDEDTDEVIDVVLLWWRDGDGDLVDTLMDAIAPLADDGTLGQHRLVADLHDQHGRPDGAAMDVDGGYWICANDGGRVLRFTPEGRVDRILAVPVSKPSMCSFGGDALDTLFVTSIQPANPQGDDIALAGEVFALRPGTQGLAETPFRPPR